MEHRRLSARNNRTVTVAATVSRFTYLLLLLGHASKIRASSAFVASKRPFSFGVPTKFREKTGAHFRSSEVIRKTFPPIATRMSLSTETETKNESNQDLRFHEIVERDGKEVGVTSTGTIAVKLLVVVPIWLTLVLPLTIAYQAGKSILGMVRGSKEEEEEEDGSLEAPSVAVTDVIPRPDRKHDVVVLGATGFTGGLAVRHLAKTYGTGNSGKVRWAIAGRSKTKLGSVLQRLADELSMPELAEDGAVDTIVCDTSDPKTLPSLVRDTRSVATTAGPFSLYGNGVVEACSKYGTHYTDITGESSFVKRMKSLYEETAIESGARIVSLCGNDCVPWDLSYNLLADEFATRGEAMESVEFANEFSSDASGGTLKTMCMGIGGKLAKVAPKDENTLRRAFGSTVEHESPMENAISNGIKRGVPKPWKLSGDEPRGADAGDDALVEAPFVMAGVNYETVSWSHALRKDSRCSYKEQLLVPDFKTGLDGTLTLLVFFTSLMNPLTGGLLEKLITQPGDGPDLKSMEDSYFLAATGTARGSKGTILQSLLYYDKDPGYLETARMVVESALCLALEEDAVSANIAPATETRSDSDPSSVGGFFSPGFALRKNLMRRLVDTGCHYDVRVVKEAA